MSDFWTDWSQDRRIAQTEEQVAAVAASAARSGSRLAEQMRQQSGNLQAQIDRLTEAFIAFVEYEDVRGELNQYADSAAVRRHARDVVSATVMTGNAGMYGATTPADVPGYWLAPAARALAADAEAGPADHEEHPDLTEALRRDPARTALFLVLLDAVGRQERWAGQHLPALLPTTPEVTVGQRALWIAITEGRLGDQARKDLTAALATVVGTPAPEVLVDALGSGSPVDRLSRLRSWVTRAAVSDGGRGSGDSGQPGTAATTQDDSEDPLADCLRTLVDEGAPAEADTLDRMAEARSRMGFVASSQSAHQWNAPAGTVLDLLVADLGGDGVPQPRRALALTVLAPVVRACTDQLQQDAAQPAPTERTVTTAGITLTVREDGVAEESWRDQVVGRLRARRPAATWVRPAGYAAGGLAAVALLLALTEPQLAPLAWIVVVMAAVAGVVLLGRDHTQRRDARAYLEATLSSVEGRLTEASRTLRTDRQTAESGAAAAVEHRTAILGLLA